MTVTIAASTSSPRAPGRGPRTRGTPPGDMSDVRRQRCSVDLPSGIGITGHLRTWALLEVSIPTPRQFISRAARQGRRAPFSARGHFIRRRVQRGRFVLRGGCPAWAIGQSHVLSQAVRHGRRSPRGGRCERPLPRPRLGASARRGIPEARRLRLITSCRERCRAAAVGRRRVARRGEVADDPSAPCRLPRASFCLEVRKRPPPWGPRAVIPSPRACPPWAGAVEFGNAAVSPRGGRGRGGRGEGSSFRRRHRRLWHRPRLRRRPRRASQLGLLQGSTGALQAQLRWRWLPSSTSCFSLPCNSSMRRQGSPTEPSTP